MVESKEIARPGAATPGRAGEQNNFQSISFQSPQGHFTPAGVQIQGILLPGRENAIPLRDLVSLTGLDARTVRVMIQAERLAGALILSDNKRGYFLPGDDEERREFVRSMRHRAEAILRAAEAVERG
jgi:hypothetical protein